MIINEIKIGDYCNKFFSDDESCNDYLSMPLCALRSDNTYLLMKIIINTIIIIITINVVINQNDN